MPGMRLMILESRGKLIPLLDNAYQGYASGELAKDGYSQQLQLVGIRGSFTVPTINGVSVRSHSFQDLPGYSPIQSPFHLRYVRFTQSGMEFFIVAWHILGLVLECSVPLRWAHSHNQL